MATKSQVVRAAKRIGADIDWRNSAVDGSDCMIFIDAPYGHLFRYNHERVIAHGWVNSMGQKPEFWDEVLERLEDGVYAFDEEE